MENKKQLSDELLTEIAEMKKRFAELYGTTGLISIGSYLGVHLSESAFLGTFNDYKSEARDDSDYPEELSAYHNGVRFFCIR